MSRISISHSNAKSLVLRGQRVPIKNSRPVAVVHAVACPVCGVGVGEQCRSAAGKPSTSSVHRKRHRLAVRKEGAAHIATDGLLAGAK